MTRGSWTFAALALAILVVVGAGWVLVSDGKPGSIADVNVVGPNAPGSTSPGNALTAEPTSSRPSNAQKTGTQAQPQRLAGPPTEWPQLKGIAIDAATSKPVGTFTYWVVPHDGTDPLARLAGIPAHRHKAKSGIFRSRQRPGFYDVVLEAPGYQRCVRTNLQVPLQDNKKIGFTLERGAGISGTIYTEDGLRAPHIPVFLHVTRLEEGSEPPRNAASKTAADGTFLFTPLDPGRYAVSLLEPDNKRDRLPAIFVEQAITKIDMTLATRHQVTLQLRDPNGRPVPEARVVLVGDGRVATGTATKGGLVVLNHVDDGSYSLRVNGKGFEPYTEELVLEGGFGQTMRWIGLERSTPR